MSAATVTITGPVPDTVLPGAAGPINEQHILAKRDAQSAICHAIECGQLLIKAKAKLPHGEFGKWIATHIAFSQATANNYMRLAQNPNALVNSNALRHLYQSGQPGAEVGRRDHHEGDVQRLRELHRKGVCKLTPAEGTELSTLADELVPQAVRKTLTFSKPVNEYGEFIPLIPPDEPQATTKVANSPEMLTVQWPVNATPEQIAKVLLGMYGPEGHLRVRRIGIKILEATGDIIANKPHFSIGFNTRGAP